MGRIPRAIRNYISQFFTDENIPESSGDVDHDSTTGGTTGNPHADSAAVSDVSSIQSSSDVDHDSTTGGTSGNPHSSSASTNHGNDDENYTIQIDGVEINSGDTINFQTN